MAKIIVDNAADIIPNVKSAGIILNSRFSDIQEKPNKIQHRSGIIVYYFENVSIFVVDDKVTQIGVSKKYKGKLLGSIGINSTLTQLEECCGKVLEDDEDNIVVEGLPGICFETCAWKGESGKEIIEENMDSVIEEIFVYNEK